MTTTNGAMFFREIIAVDCENHMKHINEIQGESAVSLVVVSCGTYSYHCALKM
jgi:hypothetical protein